MRRKPRLLRPTREKLIISAPRAAKTLLIKNPKNTLAVRRNRNSKSKYNGHSNFAKRAGGHIKTVTWCLCVDVQDNELDAQPISEFGIARMIFTPVFSNGAPNEAHRYR